MFLKDKSAMALLTYIPNVCQIPRLHHQRHSPVNHTCRTTTLDTEVSVKRKVIQIAFAEKNICKLENNLFSF